MDKLITGFVYRWKIVIVTFTIAMAALLGFLGFTRIGINPDLTGIAPVGKEYYKEQIDFLKRKLTSNILTVALYSNGDVETGKKALKELMDMFLESGYVDSALRFDTPEILVKYGIFSMEPGNLERIIKEYSNLKVLGQSIINFKFWRNLGIALSTVESYLEDYSKRKGFNEYVLVSPDGDILIMSFLLKSPVTDVKKTVKAVEKLLSIRKVVERKYGFEIKFTGGPMGTYESNLQVKRDFTLTTLFSLISISIVLYLTLGNLLTVGYLFLSMIAAMSISIGIFYILFKEINVVTSFVNAMILGLGIDYGIHLAMRLGDVVSSGKNLEEAMRVSIHEMLKPSFISALTTAGAFATLVLSGSPAFVQMGSMTFIGVWIFFLVMMIFFPSLVSIKGGSFKTFKGYETAIRFMNVLRRDWRVVTFLLVVLSILSYIGYLNMMNYWYTPPGLIDSSSESMRTYKDIKSKFPSFGLGDVIVAVDKFEDISSVSKELKRSGYFSKVTSIIDIVGNLSRTKAEELVGLYGNLVRIVNDPILSALLRKVGMYKQVLEMLKVVREAKDFKSVVDEIEKDLPIFFYRSDGKRYFLIYSLPKVDLYRNNNIKTVFEYLHSKGFKTFGYPSLFYSVMKDTKKYVYDATIMISLTIFVIILLSVRSFTPSVLIMILVVASTVGTFGLVRFWNIHVSFTTLMMVPILVGIGVDGMVHVHHSLAKVGGIIRTEKAVALSIVTTVLAFGSFAAAKGKLLQEFGLSVATGLVMSFIVTVFIFLPIVEKTLKRGEDR